MAMSGRLMGRLLHWRLCSSLLPLGALLEILLRGREFLIYLISLGLSLFRHILPREYWMNYCKYVSGIRILQQYVISPDDLRQGHKLICNFVNLRNFITNVVPTTFTSSDRSFICLLILHQKQSMLARLHVTLSGQSRQQLAIWEMKFIRSMTLMRISLNEGSYCTTKFNLSNVPSSGSGN